MAMTPEEKKKSPYTKDDGTWVRGRAAAKLKREQEEAELAKINERREKYAAPRPRFVANTKDERPDYPKEYWKEILRTGMVDFQKPNDVRERCEWFLDLTFEHGVAPSCAQLASALGISRQQLYHIVTQRPASYPEETLEVLNRYYYSIDGMQENLASAGQIQAVPWIFQAKNNFHYRDQVEHVVATTRNNDTPEQLMAEAKLLGLDDGHIDGDGEVK